MRFYRGAWLGVDNRVIYRGHFPFRPAPPQYRAEWQRHGGVAHGMRPIRGTFENHGGHLRPMSPPDTRHHQVILQRPAYRDARPVTARPPEHAPAVRSQSDKAPVEAGRRAEQSDNNRNGRDSRDNRDARDGRAQSEPAREASRDGSRAVQSNAPVSAPVSSAPASAPVSQPGQPPV